MLLLALAGPAAAKIHTDHHPGTRFGERRTYTFMEGTPARRERLEAVLHAAIEEELQAKGLSRAEEGADLIVVTHAAPQGTGGLDPDRFVYGGVPWEGWGDHSDRAGALVVDLLDGGTRQLIWRAIVTGTLPQSEDGAIRKVRKVVRKMFRDFPPR
jgi:hypothetical protein